MSASTGGTKDFQRRLSLFDATMLVAGTMIGSGIFIVSADIARDTAGAGWLILAWIITGVMTILGALCYAELAAMLPHAGGQYVFLREAYGRLPAFLYGWTAFTVIQTGTIAAVCVAFAKFLGVLIPALGTRNADLPLAQDPTVVWGMAFAEPLVMKLPLPWLSESLTVFKRTEFSISTGQLIALGLIIALSAWNCLGVREGKWLQNIFTVAKIGALILLIVVGIAIVGDSKILGHNFADSWSGIRSSDRFAATQKLVPVSHTLLAWMVLGGALVGSLFSADAWGNVTFIAAEMKDPRRHLPWALILGTALVISLYLLANLSYLSSLHLQASPPETRAALLRVSRDSELPPDKREATANQRELAKNASPADRGIEYARSDRVGTSVMELLSPRFGAGLMAIAIMISTFGCVNGIILMGPRMYYAMARDGLFFKSAGELNRHGVPTIGIIVQAIWAGFLVFSGTYSELLDYVIFAAVLFYGITAAAVIVLRVKQPQADRPYRVFAYPILPVIYIFICVAVMLDLLLVKPVYTWPGLMLVIAGIPVYGVWRWLRKQPQTSLSS
jgi:APA family basic amino acid/polyamine antiporter